MEYDKATDKRYRCKRCGHETIQTTNHREETYSLGRFNTCPKCPPWAKYPEHGGATVWEYVADVKAPRRKNPVKRRTGVSVADTIREQLRRVQSKAYHAAKHRLAGDMNKAVKYDREVDTLVRRLEKRGYGDEAFEFEELGRELAGSGHARRKLRNPVKKRRKATKRRTKIKRKRNSSERRAWEAEMKVHDQGSLFRVSITKWGVDAFDDQWPASGFPLTGFSAIFEKRNGDLVDLTGWAANPNFRGDSYGLSVLIDDMRDYGLAKLGK